VTRGLTLLAAAAAVALALALCVQVLDEREQGFRTLLAQPDLEVQGVPLNRPILAEPGWYVVIPGLHDLYRYDRRLIRHAGEPRELYVGEKLLLQVDYYMLWRIADPRRFFESFRTVERARRQVDDATYSAVRKTLAQHTLESLLSPKRAELLAAITRESDDALAPLGVRVADVRIRAVNYPAANLARVYDRMRTERGRVARRLRAEGEESARAIRAQADFDARVVRAEAEREALETRGEGDAAAARIYSDAYGRSPEFYSFVRSLEAYRTALDGDTTLVLSRKDPFLRHLLKDGPGR
jgi:membrane protease subunit HflC